MPRLACVDLVAFPLQLLLKERPDWRGQPAAVVADEKPQALLLWVNEKARRLGIRPGQRYAAALALSSALRAGAVTDSEIEAGVDRLTERLRRFSPDVEPAGEGWHSPGLFWLNAAGLGRLYASLESWGLAVREALKEEGFFSSVVVGFSRFGSYAACRGERGLRVLSHWQEEEQRAREVPLSRLDIPPEALETLLKLRVKTVGDFLELPPKGVLKRFGPEVHALHRLATGDLYAPLQPRKPEEPFRKQFELPGPETKSDRLLFFIKQLLDSLLAELYVKSLALTKLLIGFELDDHHFVEEELRPAAPTLNGRELLELVRLRLETIRFPSGVVELRVTVEGARLAREQLKLLVEKPRRDPASREQALARLRAEFGEEVVVHAQLADGHLPGSRFQWIPFRPAPTGGRDKTNPHSRPARLGQLNLIRRIYEKPLALPHRSRHEPDGWLLRGLEFGPVRDFLGPYILSGGWWRRTVEREYYFVKMQQGDVFWVFFDRVRRRWFLEGRVE